MSTQTSIVSAPSHVSVQRPLSTQIERLDQLIREVENNLEEQETYVREASLVSGSTAAAAFELQKMQLLIALLREGRERLADGSCE
jgi:hypothetical protein